MKVIECRNVHVALANGLDYLLSQGEVEQSRNGDVLVASTPVCTVYHSPTERVLFGETRDANPFFHLMESLWMLAGRNDVAFPAYFNKRFTEYSDDGIFAHGAYGFRWRAMFGMDQLQHLVDELTESPNSRRCVLQMWSAAGDLVPLDGTVEGFGVIGGLKSKDVPCNTHAYFDLRHGVLNMTVCNRSNDVVWGAYGANVVHFSILMEYLASWLGVKVGNYYQVSNNYHAYTDIYDRIKLKKIAQESIESNYYIISEENPVKPYPLMSVPIEDWNSDLRAFMRKPDEVHLYNDDFFNNVARPMFLAWQVRKTQRGNGMEYVETIKASDWKLACTQWIARREVKN